MKKLLFSALLVFFIKTVIAQPNYNDGYNGGLQYAHQIKAVVVAKPAYQFQYTLVNRYFDPLSPGNMSSTVSSNSTYAALWPNAFPAVSITAGDPTAYMNDPDGMVPLSTIWDLYILHGTPYYLGYYEGFSQGWFFEP
jgi:hypothetical protein